MQYALWSLWSTSTSSSTFFFSFSFLSLGAISFNEPQLSDIPVCRIAENLRCASKEKSLSKIYPPPPKYLVISRTALNKRHFTGRVDKCAKKKKRSNRIKESDIAEDVGPCRDLHCQCISQEIHFQKAWEGVVLNGSLVCHSLRPALITAVQWMSVFSVLNWCCHKQCHHKRTHKKENKRKLSSLSSHQLKKLIKDTILCKPIYSFSCDPYILPYLS